MLVNGFFSLSRIYGISLTKHIIITKVNHMEFLDLQIYILILIIFSSVAVLVSYIRLPYTIALVLVGLVIGYFKLLPVLELTSGLIMTVLLPVLIFDAAINIPLRDFLRNIRTILILAIPGLLVGMGICTIIIHLGSGVQWGYALLLGALLSATDPVSVLAIFQRLGVDKRLTITMKSESLVDDGVAIVVFQIVLGILLVGEFSLASAIGSFFMVTFGGLALGLVFGLIGSVILQRIDNHLIGVTVTTIVVYSTTLVAELLHQSGIIAVLAAGLVVGNYGFRRALSPISRITIVSFWEFATFIVNSIIFLLIGMQMSSVNITHYIFPIVIVFGAILVSRSTIIYCITPICSLIDGKIPFRNRHVMVWGAMRGSVVLALVLSIPQGMPQYHFILATTFGVVLLSLLVQGLTINPLVHFLGFTRLPEQKGRYQRLMGRLITSQEALRELERSWKGGGLLRSNYILLRREYRKGINELEKELDKLQDEYPDLKGEELTATRRLLIQKEREVLQEALRQGRISYQDFDHLNKMLGKRLEEIEVCTLEEEEEVKGRKKRRDWRRFQFWRR